MSKRDYLKYLGFAALPAIATKTPPPMSNEAVEYTRSLEYLPDFMRDFHDQKDIFKAIHELYKDDESLKKLPQGWTDNHIFVIDFFLWFMGQHGYKLQRVRKKDIQFFDLHKTVEEMNKRRNNGLLEILKANTTTNDTTTGND